MKSEGRTHFNIKIAFEKEAKRNVGLMPTWQFSPDIARYAADTRWTMCRTRVGLSAMTYHLLFPKSAPRRSYCLLRCSIPVRLGLCLRCCRVPASTIFMVKLRPDAPGAYFCCGYRHCCSCNHRPHCCYCCYPTEHQQQRYRRPAHLPLSCTW